MTRALVVVIAALLLVPQGSMALEKRAYAVVESDGDFELRRYEPALVAETFVEGDFEKVGSEAFRRLVGYIGGKNRAQQSISMTAPVAQEARSQKIAMTAPVAQEASAGGYRLTFVMPREYARADLPEPTDPRVQIREEPARRFASVRYSGFWSRDRYERQLVRLEQWMRGRGLVAAGEPVWARYDPPFMPWFLRTNEVLVPIDG